MELPQHTKIGRENSTEEEPPYRENENVENIFEVNTSNPFAYEISWLPNSRRWSGIITHTLVTSNSNSYVYQISRDTKSTVGVLILFSIIFFVTSLYLWISATKEMTANGQSLIPISLANLVESFFLPITLILPAIRFLIDSFLIIIPALKKREFDIISWRCLIWKRVINFSDVYAIQLVGESFYGKRGFKERYEINLVLKNKERVTIIDHGDEKSISADAEIIANSIWVPLWKLAENKSAVENQSL